MYYVMRTYSHTDKQQLWKVMSRPIMNIRDAEIWRQSCMDQEKNTKHEFFIVNSVICKDDI